MGEPPSQADVRRVRAAAQSTAEQLTRWSCKDEPALQPKLSEIRAALELAEQAFLDRDTRTAHDSYAKATAKFDALMPLESAIAECDRQEAAVEKSLSRTEQHRARVFKATEMTAVDEMLAEARGMRSRGEFREAARLLEEVDAEYERLDEIVTPRSQLMESVEAQVASLDTRPFSDEPFISTQVAQILEEYDRAAQDTVLNPTAAIPDIEKCRDRLDTLASLRGILMELHNHQGQVTVAIGHARGSGAARWVPEKFSRAERLVSEHEEQRRAGEFKRALQSLLDAQSTVREAEVEATKRSERRGRLYRLLTAVILASSGYVLLEYGSVGAGLVLVASIAGVLSMRLLRFRYAALLTIVIASLCYAGWLQYDAWRQVRDQALAAQTEAEAAWAVAGEVQRQLPSVHAQLLSEYEEANGLLEQGEHQEAIEVYQQFQSDLSQAEATADEARRARRQRERAQKRLAGISRLRGIELEELPHVAALMGQAKAALERSDYRDAAAKYGLAALMLPTAAERANTRSALASVSAQNADDASASLASLVEGQFNNANQVTNRAQILYADGKVDEAADEFIEATRQFRECRNRLKTVVDLAGLLRQSLAELARRFESLEEPATLCDSTVAEIRSSMKAARAADAGTDLEQAKALIQRADGVLRSLQQDPTNALLRELDTTTPGLARAKIVKALIELGRRQSERGEAEQAEKAANGLLKRFEHAGDAYLVRGRARLALDRVDEAMQDFDAAIEHSDLKSNAHVWKARGLLHKGDPDQAWKEAGRSLRADSTNPYARAVRGEVLTVQGKSEKAIVDLDAAIDGGADEAWVYTVRAGVREALGEAAGAAEDRQAAVERSTPESVAKPLLASVPADTLTAEPKRKSRRPRRPKASAPGSQTATKGTSSKLGDTVFPALLMGVIAAGLLWLLSAVFGASRRCPKCGKPGAGVSTGSEYVNSEMETHNVYLIRNGRGSWEREQRSVRLYNDTYRCKYCGNTWKGKVHT